MLRSNFLLSITVQGSHFNDLFKETKCLFISLEKFNCLYSKLRKCYSNPGLYNSVFQRRYDDWSVNSKMAASISTTLFLPPALTVRFVWIFIYRSSCVWERKEINSLNLIRTDYRESFETSMRINSYKGQFDATSNLKGVKLYLVFDKILFSEKWNEGILNEIIVFFLLNISKYKERVTIFVHSYNQKRKSSLIFNKMATNVPVFIEDIVFNIHSFNKRALAPPLANARIDVAFLVGP